MRAFFKMFAVAIRRIPIFLLVAVLTFRSNSVEAGVLQEIRFSKGSSGATLEGAVLRGERDRYLLDASKGQFLSFGINSLERNAVVDVFLPGTYDALETKASGTSVPAEKEAVNAVIELPTSGRVLLVVGSTRGNASYRLIVSITNSRPEQTKQYPIEIVEDATYRQKFAKLLGPSLGDFTARLQTASPLLHDGSWIIGTGMAPHLGGEEEAAFAINRKAGVRSFILHMSA